MSPETGFSLPDSANYVLEARLIDLVLNTVASANTRRNYRIGLKRFFEWVRASRSAPKLTNTLIGEYRAELIHAGLSVATVKSRLVPVRRLAREMADKGLLDGPH